MSKVASPVRKGIVLRALLDLVRGRFETELVASTTPTLSHLLCLFDPQAYLGAVGKSRDSSRYGLPPEGTTVLG
jgi:hypothetical protein